MKHVGPRGGRVPAIALIVVFTALLALPALAQEEEGSTTTTTVGEQIVPAVPVEPPTTTPATLDWTYRYLIPTGLVLAGVIILMTSIRYFTNVVRKRYRIVGE